MRRREFITLLSGVAVGWPLATQAQQAGPDKPRRVGTLMPGMASDWANIRTLQALVEGLREHGWEEGRKVVLEARFAGPDPARFLELAAELVALKVDVIIAGNAQSIGAARRNTATIPIIMAGPTDPVKMGFVASLSRPGSNITGLASQMETVAGKHFELLKEIKPGIERIGIIYDPTNPSSLANFKVQAEEMAPRLGFTVLPLPVAKPTDFEEVFTTIARERLQALEVHTTPIVNAHRAKVASFAIDHRLPTVTALPTFAHDGLLMSYGNDVVASWGRTASYVDRIFKGGNPAETPVEQVDQFLFIINLKTAKALGLTVPPSLLARADEVIE